MCVSINLTRTDYNILFRDSTYLEIPEGKWIIFILKLFLNYNFVIYTYIIDFLKKM